MGIIKAYRFRIYPSREQLELLNHHLWLSKELWNELLAHTKRMYRDYGHFATKYSLQLMVKGAGLYSQTQQEIAHRVFNAVGRFLELRRQGIRCGFPRFKPFGRIRSLHYPQNGFRIEGKKLKVTPFGYILMKQHRWIDGKIKNLVLKRKPSGKWFPSL